MILETKNMNENIDTVDIVIEKSFVIEKDGMPLGSFSGYAAVYNNTDRDRDVIKEGAFGKISQKSVPLLFNHKKDHVLGNATVTETPSGLYCEGQLVLSVAKNKDVYELMKANAISKMSCSFTVKRSDFYMQDGIRYIEKANLIEVSIVSVPANEKADIIALKSDGGLACETVRDFENILRDVGFTNKKAKMLASMTKEYWSKKGSESSYDNETAEQKMSEEKGCKDKTEKNCEDKKSNEMLQKSLQAMRDEITILKIKNLT